MLSIVLTGCATGGGQTGISKQSAGMVIGGILGGYLARDIGGGKEEETAAIIIGTLAGAAIGGAIGRSMDDVDRLKTGTTLETVRTGVSSQWVNPDTGNSFRVTPTQTMITSGGPCRNFTIDALVDGAQQAVSGVACRQNDGSWLIQ
jgi:surface antigen